MSCSQHGCKQKIFKTKKEGEKKNHSSCAISHMHTLSLRTLPEDDHSANFLSAGSQIDPISIFPLLQRTVCWVTYLVLHKRFLSWYLKKNTLEKKPQIKSQISSLLRMSWPRVEEEKRKKSSEAKAEDQRRLEKNWSKSDGYFGSGKLQIGTIMLTPPPWNIFGWQNPLIDSLWWWMLPLRVDPGSFPPLLFKPVFLSTSLFCPVAIYLYNCLCGLSPSSATDTLWFFMLMFSLLSFFGRFFPPSLWDTVLFRLSSPSPLRKHPLPRIFSEYFLLMHTYTHIYMSPTRFSPHWRLIGFRDAFSPRIARTGFGHSFVPRRLPERLSWVAESLLLSVISFCFWRSVRTNKMAACCFYSSDTGGGFEVQQH